MVALTPISLLTFDQPQYVSRWPMDCWNLGEILQMVFLIQGSIYLPRVPARTSFCSRAELVLGFFLRFVIFEPICWKYALIPILMHLQTLLWQRVAKMLMLIEPWMRCSHEITRYLPSTQISCNSFQCTVITLKCSLALEIVCILLKSLVSVLYISS